MFYLNSFWPRDQLLFSLDERRDSMFVYIFDNIFALSHVFSNHNSEFTDRIMGFISFPLIMTLASSAYIMVYNNSEILYI